MSKEKLMRLAERALKRTKSYQDNRKMGISDEENYNIEYFLMKGNKVTPEDMIVYASYEDSIIFLHPLEENMKERYLWDRNFSFKNDLFDFLENG